MLHTLVRSFVLVSGMLLVALASVPGSAGTDMEVTGEVRLRYEGDDRSFMTNEKMKHFVLQRTRLQVAAHNEKGAGIVVQLQDSRQWGDEGSSATDTENVDLHQGYLHVQDLLDLTGLDLIAGRQEIAYGRHRIVGDFGWSNVGRSFDVARLRYHVDDAWIDVTGGVVSDTHRGAGAGTEENVFMLVGHYTTNGAGLVDLTIEPLLIYRDVDPPGESNAIHQTSVGAYASWSNDRLGVEGDFIYQTGERGDGSIDAMLGAIDVSFALSSDKRLGLLGGFDFYTGDDPDDDGDSRYDFVYPTNHKFYGLMDLAIGLAGDRGLSDLHFKAWWKTPQDIQLIGAFHTFSTEFEAMIPSGDEKSLGNEFDLTIKKMLDQGLGVELGGGIFLPGDVTKELEGDENAYWGYVQGTAAF